MAKRSVIIDGIDKCGIQLTETEDKHHLSVRIFNTETDDFLAEAILDYVGYKAVLDVCKEYGDYKLTVGPPDPEDEYEEEFNSCVRKAKREEGKEDEPNDEQI